MNNQYTENFDGITAGEEFKQNTIEKMIQSARESPAPVTAPPKNKKRSAWTWNAKTITALSSAAVFVFCAIFIPIMVLRGDRPTPPTVPKGMIQLSRELFADARVDLSGAVSIALASEGKTASAASADAGDSGTRSAAAPLAAKAGKPNAAPLGDTGESAKNWLMTFDGDGKVEKVVFYQETESEGMVITQEEIYGRPKKMYVSGDFIFVHYVSAAYDKDDSDERERAADYDLIHYYSARWIYQSFVVYKPTGKVYPLADIAPDCSNVRVDIVDGNVIKVWAYGDGRVIDGKYYRLSIEGGALNCADLMPNTNIEVRNIISDKFGNVFVQTDKIAQKEGSVLYYTSDLLFKGDDGYVYELKGQNMKYPGFSDFHGVTVKYYDENIVLQDAPGDKNVFLATKHDAWSEGDRRLLSGNYLYFISHGMYVYFNSGEGYYRQWNAVSFAGAGENRYFGGQIFTVQGEMLALVADDNHILTLVHLDISVIESPALNYGMREYGGWHWIEGGWEEGEDGAEVWVDGESVFIPHYTENDPEWNYHYFEGVPAFPDSAVKPVTPATSAYMQGGILYAVVDTLNSREVFVISVDQDKNITALPMSAMTFAGTIITILPLN